MLKYKNLWEFTSYFLKYVRYSTLLCTIKAVEDNPNELLGRLTSWMAGVAGPHPQRERGWCWWVCPAQAAQACSVRSAPREACANWPETQTWWKLWRADLSLLHLEEWHQGPPVMIEKITDESLRLHWFPFNVCNRDFFFKVCFQLTPVGATGSGLAVYRLFFPS